MSKNAKVMGDWVAVRDCSKGGSNYFGIGKDRRKSKGASEPDIVAVINPQTNQPIHFDLSDLMFGLSQVFGKEILAKMLDISPPSGRIEDKKTETEAIADNNKKGEKSGVWIPEVNPDVVTIYSDGAVSGNGTPESYGGWGAVLSYKGNEKDMYGGLDEITTNQRAELLGAIIPLESLKTKSIPVEIYTDSAYVYNCFQNKWRELWEGNGWINSKKEPVANRDLWMRLFDAIDRQKKVRFYKVKGHAGIPLNERADALAVKGKKEVELKRSASK